MRLPRFRLATLMYWGVSLALVLALIAQNLAAGRREQALKASLARSLRDERSRRSIDRLLTDRGIDILKGATEVEFLTAIPKHSNDLDPAIKATGRFVPGLSATRLVASLLDHRNHEFSNVDDLPIPEVGFRFKRGDVLDVLIMSSMGSHQDIWVEIRDRSGKITHSAGPRCWGDPDLVAMLQELRADGFPIP